MSEILKSLEETRLNLETILADQRRTMGSDWDALNAELKRVRQAAKDEIEKLQQTNQRLVELVTGAVSFSQHHHACGLLNHPSSNACTCGLDELRAAIKKVKGKL